MQQGEYFSKVVQSIAQIQKFILTFHKKPQQV
ncbi:hypothetical protein ABID22_000591 [Pontibacter aydingkolensis]